APPPRCSPSPPPPPPLYTLSLHDALPICEPCCDLGIADHARRQRHLERQQVATHAGVEHVARIGQHLDRRRGVFEIIRREPPARSEEHTSELQSRGHLVCRLLLEKKKNTE